MMTKQLLSKIARVRLAVPTRNDQEIAVPVDKSRPVLLSGAAAPLTAAISSPADAASADAKVLDLERRIREAAAEWADLEYANATQGHEYRGAIDFWADEIGDVLTELCDEMVALRATTFEGICAKARAFKIAERDDLDESIVAELLEWRANNPSLRGSAA